MLSRLGELLNTQKNVHFWPPRGPPGTPPGGGPKMGVSGGPKMAPQTPYFGPPWGVSWGLLGGPPPAAALGPAPSSGRRTPQGAYLLPLPAPGGPSGSGCAL